ncbi:MAG: metal-dependent hydrolase [Bradymonadaceae bacterium]|nr:metal-dependent hydrolase [Lujinxingiaceae bacterium]
MDNLAHSLLGATLAQAGLKRYSPLATATLVIGANLPDIDALTTVLGSDASLYYRRGLTHGVLAMVILPILLAITMILYDRHVRRRRDPTKDPALFLPLLALAYIGTLSHPVLDWLNTYGVRVLMPFDGRWFYGDTLFIVDPWFWLLMAASVVFAHSHTKFSKRAWLFGTALATTLVTFVPIVPLAAKIVWWLAVALIAYRRHKGVETTRVPLYARACLIALCLYLAALFGTNALAKNGVHDHLASQNITPLEMMTSPLPANPFARQVIVKTQTHYHAINVRWLQTPTHSPAYPPVPIEPPNAIVQRALDQPQVRGFRNWMRYPTYEVRPRHNGGHRVYIRDLRYATPDAEPGRGIGIAIVDLD